MSESGKKGKLFDDGYFGKILLLLFDKLLLGAVVICLLTPVQHRLAAIQQRHDKATQIADLVVDKAIETLGRLSLDIDKYTAAIRTRVRGGDKDNVPLVESRAQIEAGIAALSAYLPALEVRDAGRDLAESVQQLTVDAMTQRVPLTDVNQRVHDVNDKAAALTRQVVAACRTEISKNVDQAYQ